MKEKYLYLAIDFFTILVPFIASFYPKVPFYKKWKHLWIAILIPGIFFLIWDELFTAWGIWGFNPRYISGIAVGNLPIEEILFFVCIPYACVFTYFSLEYLVEKDYLRRWQRGISTVLIGVMLVTGLAFVTHLYTATAFLFLAAFVAFEEYYRKVTYLSRFYFTYIIILIPFFIVNGILTGSFIEQEVVWYNDAHNLGIRMGTIPVEDTFYGMLLLMMNVSLYTKLNAKAGKIE